MATHGTRRGIQPLRCSVCGSVWFRLTTCCASNPRVRLSAVLAVCLCGAPVTPQLSGIRPPDDQYEIDQLLAALATVSRLRQAIPDTEILPVSVGATLATQIARLESACQTLQRRLLPNSTAVTRPRLPRREASTHSLDAIALELQRAGLQNFRQARRVVWAVRDLWKAALANGESVETPLGVLSIRQTPSGRQAFVFKAFSGLHFEVVEVNRPSAPGTNKTTTGAAQPKLSAHNEVCNMPPTPNAASPVQCPRCGSQWFARQEFRQYADLYSSTVGGSLSPLSNDPQYAPVCLCGTLFQPKGYTSRGHLLTPDELSFLESWKRAQEYQLLQSQVEERTLERLRAAVTPEYIQQLSARLESAEKSIADLSAELKGRHLKPRQNTA
jgi:hypothetical protein